MLIHVEQVQFHLQGGIGQRTKQVRFGHHFHGHQVQKGHSQGTNVLVDGPAFLHDEYILPFQLLDGRELAWYIDGHDGLFQLITPKDKLLFPSIIHYGRSSNEKGHSKGWRIPEKMCYPLPESWSLEQNPYAIA